MVSWRGATLLCDRCSSGFGPGDVAGARCQFHDPVRVTTTYGLPGGPFRRMVERVTVDGDAVRVEREVLAWAAIDRVVVKLER